MYAPSAHLNRYKRFTSQLLQCVPDRFESSRWLVVITQKFGPVLMAANQTNSSGHHFTNPTNEEENEDADSWMGFFSPQHDIFPICLAVLVVLVNACVLVLVLRKKSLRTVTNLLLCSLALSDLITGLFSIPLFIACNVIREAPVCIASDQFLRFTSVSTVCHLFTVTLDRYLAIIHALRYCSLVTRPRAVVAVSFIWMLSAMMSIVQLTWSDPANVDLNGEPSDDVIQNEIRYDVTCVVTFFGAPLVFMAIAYGRIFREIVRQNRIIQQHSVPGWHKMRFTVIRECRAVFIFVTMLSLYVACWLPYFIIRLEINFDVELIVQTDAAEYTMVYLRFFTSLLNPCLYILGKNDFRKAIKFPIRRTSLKSSNTMNIPPPTGSCASRRTSSQTQRTREACI